MIGDTIGIDGFGGVTSARYDLTHCKTAIGAPITLEALSKNADLLVSWLRMPREPTGRPIPGMEDRLEILQSFDDWMAACHLPTSPPARLPPGHVLEGSQPAAAWEHCCQPPDRGWRGPGRWKGSRRGLVALGMKSTGRPWKLASAGTLKGLWFAAIVARGVGHLEMESRLLNVALRARFALHRRPRAGGFKALLLFAAA